MDKLSAPFEIRERAACASLSTRWIAEWLAGCATTARGGRGIGEEAAIDGVWSSDGVADNGRA